MDEAIQVSCIIDKLLHSWKDFKHTLKHFKEELTLIELGSHLCIEESLRGDKPKGNNVVGPSVVNLVEHNNSSRVVVRLPNPKLKTVGERGIECVFVGYAEYSKAFMFYVIKPIPKPGLRILNGTEDIGGSVVAQEVTKEVVTQLPEPELRKGKRNRTPKNFGGEFQL
nr:zinc finger, CCHC-type [Tanacetum cinerariifolium]